MASTQEMIQSLTGSSGKQAEAPATEHVSSATEDTDQEARAENSSIDGQIFPDGDDTPADPSKQAPDKATSESKKVSGDKEFITVTDESGKKRKVEVDYSDRERIKKAFSMESGARKWAAERDQAIQSGKKVQEQLEQKNKDWGVLEAAYQKGPEELFDLLAGRRGAFQAHIDKKIQRADFLKNASPDEVERLEAREAAERRDQELSKIRKENEDFRNQITREKDEAELRSLESHVHPVFDKYRFSEKLGNADDEHMFDQMLWDSAMKRLEPYEESGQLTPERIDAEFRSVASAIRKRVGVQAEKTASRVVAQKKQEATENVQAKVMSGYTNGGKRSQEARDLINSGNLTGLLKGWGKYGSLFQK